MLDKLEAIKARFEQLGVALTNPEIVNDNKKLAATSKEYRSLEKIVNAQNEYKKVLSDIEFFKEALNGDDEELRELAKEEAPELDKRKEDLESYIRQLLIPKDPQDEKNAILEIRAGTGGDEASLFAGDLLRGGAVSLGLGDLGVRGHAADEACVWARSYMPLSRVVEHVDRALNPFVHQARPHAAERQHHRHAPRRYPHVRKPGRDRRRQQRRQPLRSAQDDHNNDEAVEDEPVLVGEAERLRQHGEQHGTQHRPPQCLQAAEQQKDDEVQGHEEAEIVRADDQDVMGLDGTGQADEGASERKAHRAGERDRDAHGACCDRVVAHGAAGKAQS